MLAMSLPGPLRGRLAEVLPRGSSGERPVRLGLIGIGGFARSVHIPNLKKLRAVFDIRAIASRSSSRAAQGAKLTSASIVTADYQELLAPPGDRRGAHRERVTRATLAIAGEALAAGKNTCSSRKKPLATTVDDCQTIEKTCA